MRNLLHLLRAQSAAGMTIAAAALAFSANAPFNAALALDSPAAVAQTEKPSGQGALNAIDAANRKLNITHGPITVLKWPGMTMDFGVAPSVDLAALKPGEKIVFTLTRGDDGMYLVDDVKPSN